MKDVNPLRSSAGGAHASPVSMDEDLGQHSRLPGAHPSVTPSRGTPRGLGERSGMSARYQSGRRTHHGPIHHLVARGIDQVQDLVSESTGMVESVIAGSSTSLI